jgi:hypothetical protein
VIMVVDENKRKIITAVETGGPYESEIEMLRLRCGGYYRKPFGQRI